MASYDSITVSNNVITAIISEFDEDGRLWKFKIYDDEGTPNTWEASVSDVNMDYGSESATKIQFDSGYSECVISGVTVLTTIVKLEILFGTTVVFQDTAVNESFTYGGDFIITDFELTFTTSVDLTP